MHRNLSLIIINFNCLIACFFFGFAATGIQNGYVSIGRVNPWMAYESTNPHGFWIVVLSRVVVGIFFMGISIFQISKTVIPKAQR